MNSIVIGRYLPGNSWIHRLDPRTKIILTFVYIMILLFANSWGTYLVASIFLVGVIYLTKQPLNLYWQGIKPILWLILFTVILQIFFTGGQPVLWQWQFIKVTQPGFINAIYVVIRFVLIILMSTIMTLTTPPTSIASALESLLGPLKKLRVPVAELALMLSIALRFVPLLMDETQKIMNAQKSRGMSFSTGGPIKRAKAVVPLLVPLFVGALQRALDLANAMEVRGFKDADHRTRYRVLAYHRADYVSGLVMVLFIIVFSLINLMGW
ncbi:energy-coupling factor transporter transmembrane component T family protein [Convivina intestini]|uniref:Energy-coupling factor transporter transmembrane protein EcfT n=1 Tax=Convivina intestini TaxID=1505726 RepID=A0A2U1D6Z5_9LACO|nr:energy-coupling factor transporter transmembrane component T [Convivina intestini]PVY83444.1 energy-coupling factor transport system permease protein [Convivina intestini]CAH1855865.1 Energy-coupling factor transporter transmembrane protein EcfT [Convivina intestini]SDC03376.1 energy-coupling factor transport system permease protein [Leuconostocaceae bacterium R-53105]